MFTGCGTALVTPFRQDLSLDESTLRRLVRRQIASGISFLVPCGTTGESPTLSRAEHLRVVEITLEEAKGKVPVLAGAGGYNTHEVIELAGEIEAWARTASSPSPPTTTAHAGRPVPALPRHRQCRAPAHRRVQRAGAHGRQRGARHAGASGEDRQHRGRQGSQRQHRANATVLNEVPADFIVPQWRRRYHHPAGSSRRTRHHLCGGQRDPRRNDGHRASLPAQRFSRRARDSGETPPLMNINFVESNPIPVKAAMALMGLLEPVWRLPMVPPSQANLAKIESVLQSVGLLVHSRTQPGDRPGCPRAAKKRGLGQSGQSPSGDHLCNHSSKASRAKTRRLHGRRSRTSTQFLVALTEGRIRAAEPDRGGQRLARQRLGQEGHPAGIPHGINIDMSVGRTQLP